MDILYLIHLLFFSTLASCRIYSVENPDGSYSIGLNSDSTGQTANSVLALLSKSAGYTINKDYESEPPQNKESEESQYEYYGPESRNLLSPHIEILKLIEAFLQFKAEAASRFQAIISDNYDLIRSLYQTVISKVGTLHSFTLTGIRILRKILEIAVSFMAQWSVNIPGLSLDLSLGGNSGGQGSSFSVNKNGNWFSG